MKLISLEIGEKFRSLHSGFKIDFHSLSESDMYSMLEFQPFCFAGLNGSGKSNILEALASIFYHLELCVAKFRPKSLNKYFREEISSPDVFTLVYLIGEKDNPDVKFTGFSKITIVKEKGIAPKMYRQKIDIPFLFEEKKTEISLTPIKTTSYTQSADGKVYLPDIIVGYSSGENEILSIPFIKNRLVHFDEYKEAIIKNYDYLEPESSLIYIDANMSQAVLLSILLFENDITLKPLEKELQIKGMRSFRMNLNLHTIYHDKEKKSSSQILQQLNPGIDKLKTCASSWFVDDSKLILDFFVDDQTKNVFRANFKNSFELFRLLQIFYELNYRVVEETIKEEVYSSKGYYTDGKLPSGSPEQNVFYFLDFFIKKQVDVKKEPIELLLRNFSDGEHQFLHAMGICLMLKDRRSLLLLDEPETHFNPGWRAKFIKVLNDSIKAGGGNNNLKEILLTSHSPFIISDCMPEKVMRFEKNENGKISVQTAEELGLNTFGTSSNLLTMKFFGQTGTIAELSNDKLKKIKELLIKNDINKEQAIKEVEKIGESIEKTILLDFIRRTE